MPKEKSINPAQAQRKADKAKAIKKGKAENASRRNEKLARRNPDRLQKQLDELKQITSSGGTLTSHEKSVLEGLERDIKAVKKARETLGDKAPAFGRGDGSSRGGRGDFGGGGDRGGRGGGVLGKRRRDEDESSEDGVEVEEEVRRIPMPRDTPPPIPKEVLDKWWGKRRERLARERGTGPGAGMGAGTSANSMPLGGGERRTGGRGEREGDTGGMAVERPVLREEAKTVYEAKPAIRDLRKEAVAFVPAAVREKIDKLRGVGGLVEPEEADRLEKAGYMGQRKGDDAGDGLTMQQKARPVVMEEVEDEDA